MILEEILINNINLKKEKMETMKLVFGNDSVDVEDSNISTIVLQHDKSVVNFKGEKWKFERVEYDLDETGFTSRSFIFKKVLDIL